MFAAEITFDQVTDVLVAVGAFFAAVGGFYYWAWKPFVNQDQDRAQRIANQAASLAVEPLRDTLADLNRKVDTIKGEVQINGGKSLKDVVLDTREHQIALEARFEQHMKEGHHYE